MLFYGGIILAVAGLIQLIRFFIKSRRERVEAFVKEVFMDFYIKDPAKRRKYPHAIITYTFRSIDYEKKIFLMKRKVVEGDKIHITFKNNDPDKVEMFAPQQEMLTGIAMLVIGVGLMIAAYAITQAFF